MKIPHFVLPLYFFTLSLAQAETISLNFVRGSDGAINMPTASIAGAVPVANWNNSPQANANTNTGFALVNEFGVATTATADWQSGGASWSVVHTGTAAAGDLEMMTGYLDQGGTGVGQIHTVTINNIPYANYDVYLYHSSSGGPNRTARYRANGYDLFTRNLTPADVLNTYITSQYVTLADATVSALAGNYIRWDRMIGATLNIEAQGLGDTDGGSGEVNVRAPIQGIQIVEITVPADLPKVETLPASSIGIDIATANGTLISNGAGASQADLTLYWGITDGGSDALAWGNSMPFGSASAPGDFNAILTGLEPSFIYYYRVFSSNSVGGDWATSSAAFKTLPRPVDAISLNFVRGSTGATAMLPTDAAGVVRAINWNNAPQANADSHSAFALIDAHGASTSASANWQSGSGSWSIAITGTGDTTNKKMLTGYLDQSDNGLNQIHSITVNNIPYSTYDVYLYHSSTQGPNRSARYNANTIDLYTRNLAPADIFDGFTADQHSSLADSNNSATGGNYVVWQGMSGTLSIEGQAIGATDGGYPGSGDVRRAAIQGIQIVSAESTASFKILSIDYDTVSSKVTLVWESKENVPYEIQISTTMKTSEWTPLQTVNGSPNTTTFDHFLSAPVPPTLFYRISR